MDVRGMTIVLVGRFHGLRRSEVKRRLEELGARMTGTVSDRTDLVFSEYLFAEAGRNLQQARERGIPICDESALRALLADPDATDDEGEPGAESDLVALRARLLKLEREQGITEEHRAATREIRAGEDAQLLHPYGHQVEINDYALSPCGRYLATGTWRGDDSAVGGTLQIWELATGRCVNILGSLDGGIGRPGEGGGIQWSDDSRRIGLAYHRNRIGVFDPFDPALRSNNWAVAPLALAMVADEAAAPPAWALAPDGRRAFVASASPCDVGGSVIPLDRGDLHWTPGQAPPRHPFLLAERLRERLRPAQVRGHGAVDLQADHVRWSRDGTRLQAQAEGGPGYRKAFVVDVASGQVDWRAAIGGLAAWSPDDRLLAHYYDGLRFLDAATGRPRAKGAGHRGVSALQWGMRGDMPRLAALVGAGNTAGAEPGVFVYDGHRFRYRVDVAPVDVDQVFADSWAWSPSGDAGAWLTADGRVEVWSLDGDAPRRQRTLDVPPETGVVLWGADDVLVAMSPTTLRFLRAGSGDVLGDFTFLREPGGPRALPDDWWLDTCHFAPDDEAWCAAFPEGVVIAPDGRAARSLDDVLAWSVHKRLAWPVRWGELDVVPDAVAASALLGDERGDGSGWWLNYSLERREGRPWGTTGWPPRRSATVRDLVKTAVETCADLPGDGDGRVARDLRYAARLYARRGEHTLAGGLVRDILPRGEQVAASAEVAMILAGAGRREDARAAFRVAQQHLAAHAEVLFCKDHEIAFVAAALGGAHEALGDRARADEWFDVAHRTIAPEPRAWQNRLAVIWALTECGREDEARALWGPAAWYAEPEPDGPTVEAWLTYLARTGRRALYDAFLAAWEESAARRREDPASARLLPADLRTATASPGPAAAHLTPPTPTDSDIAELVAEYAQLQKIPRSYRMQPTQLLIERAARCGHIGAVIDLIRRLPRLEEYEARPRTAFTALRLATTGCPVEPW
ncbi:BRCT domain-containing protein [Streptomyces sp. NPDC048650]|uniref:BRCT domain-containing protein n=1 Tax=Streptomyces sp. NPDC048650 TaxID=3365583 RepID=UPI00370FC836